MRNLRISRSTGIVVAATLAVISLFAALPARAQAQPPLQTCTAEDVRATQRFWFFGQGGGIDFGVTGTTATPVVGSSETSNEGTTVVTDTTGQLLFWSNGASLFNRNHVAMPNGTGLLGHPSATQTVVAFPSLTRAGVYFVVSTSAAIEVGDQGALYYSVVDMSLDGGLGDVTSVKNVQLGASDAASEGLTAVPNADGTGFWVLTYTVDAPNVLAYEFDGNGPVTGSPVVSVMSTTNGGGAFGSLNFSADLTQLVQLAPPPAGGEAAQVRLLTFDAATGMVSERFTWDLPTGPDTGYTADFSPSGDYVYVTKIFDGARLFRYRIADATTAADVVATEELVGPIGVGGSNGDWGGAVRRAPDGRMYVAGLGTTFLSVVNDPDNANDPGFVSNGFELAEGSQSVWGLSQTVTGCPEPPPPPPLPCDLAINGSFELPDIQAEPNHPDANVVRGSVVWRTMTEPVDGWETVSGTVDIHRHVNNPSHGMQSIDLWGTAPGTFQRTFTDLIPGQEYTFSVDYSGLSAEDSVAQVLLDQGAGFEVIETLSPAADAVENGDGGIPNTPEYTVTWDTFTYTFEATGTAATVRFVNADEPARQNTGLFIDNFTFVGEGPCGTDVEATEIWWGYNPDHDTFDFYVTVRNNGPEVTDGPITVTIPLPEGVTFTMAEPGWACEVEAETNTAACTRFDLAIPVGESIRFALWSQGETPDAVTVAAHVTYPPDANPDNNVVTLDDCCGRVAEARAAEQAPAPADIAVTQTSAVTTVDLTRHVTYTVGLRNLGPEPTPQIRLSDVLPRGTTLVSATSAQGTCHAGPNGLVVACTLQALAREETAEVTITLETLHTGALTHVVSATGIVPDPAVTNNQVKETTLLPPDPALDPEGTGVPAKWRTRYGLEGDEALASADADGDGLSNLEEFLRGSHPRGLFRGHFAEGAAGFFQTDLGLVNPGEEATEVVLSFLTETGDQFTRAFTLGPGARTTVPLNAALAGWTTAAATLVESDRAVAADRLMTWPGQEYIHGAMAEDVLVPNYASSLETAVPAPSATWHFAEGATAGLFDLYYLLQNPADTEVTATIQYLRQGDTPVTRTYTVQAHSRRTIWVDAEPGLDNALVAATITADAPIVAERAMYFSPAGVFGLAGHAAAGVAAPSPTWHFAEGATGAFFDAFLLFGNPHAEPVSVDVQYQLPTGQVVVKSYVVPAQQRLTVYVDAEDATLAETAFAATVTASAPIVAERAMWWPGPTAGAWTEASATLGATTAGSRWAIAEARVGTDGRTEAGAPALPAESFVLLSNTSATAGEVRVRLITESGTTVERTVEVAGHARRTLALGAEWPELAGQRASVVVESLDAAVPITVEHACYSSIPGGVWMAGAAARATPLP